MYTDSPFAPSGAVKVDPKDAYWFDELHKKYIVYYLSMAEDDVPSGGGLLDFLDIGDQIMDPKTFYKPSDFAYAVNNSESITDYEDYAIYFFAADGSPVAGSPADLDADTRFACILYKSGGK